MQEDGEEAPAFHAGIIDAAADKADVSLLKRRSSRRYAVPSLRPADLPRRAAVPGRRFLLVGDAGKQRHQRERRRTRIDFFFFEFVIAAACAAVVVVCFAVSSSFVTKERLV